MTVFYLDPEGGNDANDGLSFANRWKSIRSGATAARIAPGDVIRVIADHGKKNLGSCVWTDNSNVVTLPAAKTLDIDACESGWVSSDPTNAPLTFDTNRKEGSASVRLAVATAFSNLKVAYKALGSTLDLSSYTAVSLMLFDDSSNTSHYNTSGWLQLKLCSDATGDVPIATLNFPASFTTWIGWKGVLIETGAALPSGINSIAIYASADLPAIPNLRFDNIIACQDRSHADHLSHWSLIGKDKTGEKEWFAIQSISGTTVTLGNHRATVSAPDPNWRGTGETVTTYAIAPLLMNESNTAQVQDSGTISSYITFSGGWNRTDMSTQDSQSWIGANYQSYGLLLFSTAYIKTEKLGFCHANTGIGFTASTNGPTAGAGGPIDLQVEGIVSCDSAFAFSPNTFAKLRIGCITHMALVALGSSDLLGSEGAWDVQIDSIMCCNGQQSSSLYGAIYMDTDACCTWGRDRRLKIGKIWANAKYGIGAFGGNHGVRIIGSSIAYNASGTIGCANGVELDLEGCSFPDAFAIGSTGLGRKSGLVRLSKVAGSLTDHRLVGRNFTFQSDATTTFGGSGLSWKINVTDATFVNQLAPVYVPLAKIACTANVARTVSFYVRRDNTGLNIGIATLDYAVAGVGDAQAYAAGIANAWEQVSLTFTPTEDGVVEIFGVVYGGTTYTGWWDAGSVT